MSINELHVGGMKVSSRSLIERATVMAERTEATEMADQAKAHGQKEVIARALQRARECGVRVMGSGARRRDGARVYVVNSASEPGVWHLVIVAGKRLACDCAAGRYGRICVHRAVVYERLAAERVTARMAEYAGPEGGDAA